MLTAWHAKSPETIRDGSRHSLEVVQKVVSLQFTHLYRTSQSHDAQSREHPPGRLCQNCVKTPSVRGVGAEAHFLAENLTVLAHLERVQNASALPFRSDLPQAIVTAAEPRSHWK